MVERSRRNDKIVISHDQELQLLLVHHLLAYDP